MNTHRIAQLVQVLQEEGLDAFFAHSPISMGYLCDFHECGHERFLTIGINTKGETAMIAPALSESQARRAGIEKIRTWNDGEDPLRLFQELASEWNLRSAMIAVDDTMPAKMLLEMQSVLPAALFKPGQPLLARLMSVKDNREIAALRHAARVGDEALKRTLPQIRTGMTERQIQEIMQTELQKGGGKPTFCIIAIGPGSGEPHHLTGETKLQEGDALLIDWGGEIDGYQSDCTRTFSWGPASEKLKEIYQVVYQAHIAAREKIGIGIPAEALDQAARQAIADAGYGTYFVHRTGHGLGMQGHEEPYIVQGNSAPLIAGNCFSIEPGIYLPGEFGVRIENIYLATESGFESLNDEPTAQILELPIRS